jgi:hypothetical protein
MFPYSNLKDILRFPLTMYRYRLINEGQEVMRRQKIETTLTSSSADTVLASYDSDGCSIREVDRTYKASLGS